MTMTYAILMTLGALGSISSAIRAPTFWIQTILDFAICGVAYSFLYDLRQIRRQMFATPVYVNSHGHGPHTTVVHMPGPSAGVPYNGQQYGQQPGGWAPPPPPYGNEQKAAYP